MSNRKKVMVLKTACSILVLFVGINWGYAQTNYRSFKSGPWNDPATWEVEVTNSSGNWTAAASSPNNLSNVIQIRADHVVTVSQNVTIDQTYILAGGTLEVNDGVTLTLLNGPGSDLEHRASSNLVLYGEGHVAGTGIPVFAGSLYVHSLNATGAITSGTNATGNIRTSARSWSNQCIIYYSGSGAQILGNGHPNVAGLTTVIQNVNGVQINNTTLATVGLGNLRIEQGTFSVSNNNLTVSGATEVLGGSISLSSEGASRTYTFADLELDGGDLSANATSNSMTLNFNGLTNLISGSINFTRNSVGATVNFTGNLSLTGGNVSFTSSGNGNLLSTYSGDISGTGLINLSGTSEVRFLGSGNFTHSFPISSSSTVSTLRLDRPGCTLTIPYSFNIGNLNIYNGAVVLNSNLTLNSQLNLATGTSLDISGYSLQVRNALNGLLTGGSIISNASASLTFAKTGAINSLNFAPGSSLGNLTLNRAATLSLSQDITIHSNINLFQGTLTNNASLTMADGARITRSSSATMTGGIPLGGPYELVYTGSDLTTGPEAQGSLANITSNLSGTLTLANALNSTGVLRVNSGNFISGTNNITVSDLFILGTFSAPSNLATSGLVVTNEINNDGTLVRNDGIITLGGNFDNTGTVSGTGDFVFTGNTTFIGTLPSFTNITVNGTLNAPSTLNLPGDFTNNGTVSGLDVLVLNGSSVQNTYGSSPFWVQTLQIANTTLPISVNHNGFIYVTEELQLATGSYLDADGDSNGGYIVLESSAAGDARVTELTEGTFIDGNVTVQRRLPPADNTAWYFTPAVQNAAVVQLQDDFEVTGFFTGTDYPCAGCEQPGANVKWYLENVDGELSRGYQQMPSNGGTNEELLIPGRGYEAYMWNGEEETIIDMRGPLNQDTINFTVSHTVSNPAVPTADGWNLIGNPFASPITWSNPGWERSTNIDPIAWGWDVLAQNWRSYDYNDASPEPIASGQGFWVYVTTPDTAILSINEEAKVSTDASFYRAKTEVLNDGLHLIVSNENYRDEAFIVATNDLTNDFDFGFDTYKPRTGYESVSLSIKGEGDKAIHKLATSPLLIGDQYDLSLAVLKAGEYTFSFNQVGNHFEDFMLVDRYLAKSVSMTDTYRFHVTGDPNSVRERFSIARREIALSSNEGETFFHAYPNPVADELIVDSHTDQSLKVTLFNPVGQPVEEQPLTGMGQTAFSMSALHSGVYILKVVSTDNKVYISKIVKR